FDPRRGDVSGGYTVHAGETLRGVAQTLWGDADLWYKIAEANGLGANAELTEGQSLTIPSGVWRSHQNAETYKPYDAGRFIGDATPTPLYPAPAPAHHGGCGVFGKILLVVIAVAVTAVTYGALTAQGAALAGGSLGSTIAAGAIAGAAGSVASQTVGVATGIQDKFSFKAVGLAALSGAVGGAAGKLLPQGAIGGSKLATDVVRGAASSAVTQGIAVATGLQHRFSWAGVAAAGIGAGVGGAIGRSLKLGDVTTDPSAHNIGASAISGAAGAIANAATRSLVTGTSFGDNILAALPDVIGSTIGNAVAGGIAGDAIKGKPSTRTYQGAKGSIDAAPESPDNAGNTEGTGSATEDIVVTARRSTDSPDYVDYFPQVTAALMDADIQIGGVGYAAARRKEQIVQSLAAQASAANPTTPTGYRAFDLMDGKANGVPEVAGWAATEFELNRRTTGLEAAYARGEFDANVYGAIKESLATNARMIEQWNAVADGEVNKLLFAGIGGPALIAGGAVAASLAAGYFGGFYVGGTASTIASGTAGFVTGGTFGAGFEFSKNRTFGLQDTGGGYTAAILGGGLGGTGLRLLPNTVLGRAVSTRVQAVALGAFSGGVGDFAGQLVTTGGDRSQVSLSQLGLAIGLGGGLGAVTPLEVRSTLVGTAGRNDSLSIYQGLNTRLNSGDIVQMRLRYPVNAGAANAVVGSGQQAVGTLIDGARQRVGR
ncbi:MAG: LysM peptidoglycan-binding domain-containing protein, partial [Proteobacteria bacterium]|nr:LysM peptidoglycan-binding domain-containing protein [Pseudomonadota bacterium]